MCIPVLSAHMQNSQSVGGSLLLTSISTGKTFEVFFTLDLHLTIPDSHRAKIVVGSSNHADRDRMRRYFIRVGDKTTAGGEVIQGEERTKHHGAALSYEGAEIYCHTCKSVGHISKVLPYRSMSLFGKQIALENDICNCKCSPPPRLIASQNTGSMSFDGEELKKMGFGSAATFGRAMSATDFDEQLRFTSPEGIPLARVRYQITLEDGSIQSGITDESGRTERIYTERIMRIVRAHFYLDSTEEGV